MHNYIAEDSHLRRSTLLGPFQTHSERTYTFSTTENIHVDIRFCI